METKTKYLRSYRVWRNYFLLVMIPHSKLFSDLGSWDTCMNVVCMWCMIIWVCKCVCLYTWKPEEEVFLRCSGWPCTHYSAITVLTWNPLVSTLVLQACDMRPGQIVSPKIYINKAVFINERWFPWQIDYKVCWWRHLVKLNLWSSFQSCHKNSIEFSTTVIIPTLSGLSQIHLNIMCFYMM